MLLLRSLPTEILSNIAVYLACDDPHAPPTHLLALRATNHFFMHTLNCHLNPAVWTAAYRFRFDHHAVLRRNFSPNGRDYYDQLQMYTEALAFIRRPAASRSNDMMDMESVLRLVYLMLLENNGKNRAQLEAAGVDRFLREYLRTRLWEYAEENDGWPLESVSNAFAVWSMWMMMTVEKLRAQSPIEQEEMVTHVLPFVLNVYRYAQAEAPPSHFNLPLLDDRIVAAASTASAHGPYPVYIPYSRTNVPYFGAIIAFSPPPISSAAKLIYFACREILPARIPPHLPATRADAPPSNEPSATQEDFLEYYSHRGAQPQPRITWDWLQGHRLIEGVPDHADVDHSAAWDPDYWRIRLCGNAWLTTPKWRPGNVYVPGSMDGLWQGRIAYPTEPFMRILIEHAAYPSHQYFNEINARVIHQPLFMRLKEYHSLSGSSSSSHVPFPDDFRRVNNGSPAGYSDLSMCNAWFPGVSGNLSLYTQSGPAYSPPGEPRNARVVLEGSAGSWLYKEFDRKLDKERREREGVEYQHYGYENCKTCREREKVLKRAKILDDEDHEAISNAYGTDWRTIEQVFDSIGLGMDETPPDADDEDMEDEDGEDMVTDESDEDMAVDEMDEPTESPEEEPQEFLDDHDADSDPTVIRPVRRGTDRAKIRECDGIQDIIFNGTTDRRHALAWSDCTFYGRVRPWDGLIGILRRSVNPRRNFEFLYGYLIGSETFVGNWRFAAVDPNMPTWESAFVMSRRKDEDQDQGQNQNQRQAGGQM